MLTRSPSPHKEFHHMRKLVATSLLVALAMIGGVFATAAQSSTSVKVGDNYFVRPTGVPKVTVKKGATVKWRFAGDSVHNVTVIKGPKKFHSPTKSSGVYKKKLRKKGTYILECTIHGSEQKMKLVVK